MKHTIKFIMLFVIISLLYACATTTNTTSPNSRHLSVSSQPYVGGPTFEKSH